MILPPWYYFQASLLRGNSCINENLLQCLFGGAALLRSSTDKVKIWSTLTNQYFFPHKRIIIHVWSEQSNAFQKYTYKFTTTGTSTGTCSAYTFLWVMITSYLMLDRHWNGIISILYKYPESKLIWTFLAASEASNIQSGIRSKHRLVSKRKQHLASKLSCNIVAELDQL